MTKVKEPTILHIITLNYFNNFKYCYNQILIFEFRLWQTLQNYDTVKLRYAMIVVTIISPSYISIFRYILKYCWYYSMLCRYYYIILYNASRRNIIFKIYTKPILTHTNINQYVFKVFFITNHRIHCKQWIVKRCRYDYNIIVFFYLILSIQLPITLF